MKFNLDRYQMEAVTTHKKNVLVVSAPGSGKTTVIVNRLIYLVKEKGINPNNIIVITFTKAAAKNMKDRYLSLTESENTPFFGTFHGLFYKILKRHYKEINIIEPKEGYRLINDILLQYMDEISEEKVKEVLNNISLFKCSNVALDNFETTIDKNIFIHCYNTYEDYKREKNLMDFDDLQIKCKDLFLKNSNILEGYRNLFRYILVDEFQDCDEIQIDMLRLLNERGSLFAVGDEDQCIYSFRGSKPDCMVEFNKIFKEGEKIFLSFNYRSAENIVEASKNLIRNNRLRNEKNIKAHRQDKKTILLRNLIDENSQGDDIASKIISYKEVDKIKYKDNAILYRTNVEARSIIDSFIRKKIPFVLMDKEYNFFEHFICKDIISYLKLSIDSYDRESFCRIINKPFRYVSKINIDKVRYNNIKEDCFEILKTIKDLPVFQMKAIDSLKRDINYLNKISLRAAIDFIIMDLGYIDYIREYSKKFKLKFEELEEILEEFKNSTEGYNSIITFLAHIEVVKEEIKNNAKRKHEDAVILTTIHGAKGMEFKNVYIVNCNEETMPHINSLKESIEEERRLFYVAITRAIDNLHIYSTKYMRGKSREVSRFIEECSISKASLNIPYSEGDKIYHQSFKEGVIKKIEGNEIDIEFESGMIRKFNFDILYMNKLISKV